MASFRPLASRGDASQWMAVAYCLVEVSRGTVAPVDGTARTLIHILSLIAVFSLYNAGLSYWVYRHRRRFLLEE
jgi:hypothetical protein